MPAAMTISTIPLEQYNKEVSALKNEIKFLNEQLDWFKRQVFGKRSERTVSDLNSQQLLLEGFENLATKEEKKKPVSGQTRKKPNRDGQDKISLPEDLPVKTTILDIPEEEKFCSETGVPLVQIGVEYLIK
jgi:hypothetical protein